MSVIGLGEVLWDLLPAGKQLGGAPANVAYHAGALGIESVIVSAVGNDKLGEELLENLREKQINSAFIQVLNDYPTGTVEVTLDEKGKPEYIIHEDVAWDHILLDDALRELIYRAEAVCFGTLAQRSEESRETIQAILELVPDSCIRVYDVNLRQNFYSADILLNNLRKTDILKINDEELPVVCKLLEITGAEDQMIQKLLKRFDLDLMALTKGSEGSRLIDRKSGSFLPTPEVNVVDTVGAGDSFTAALIYGVLHQWPLQRIHSCANELAAFVCTRKGATPKLTESVLNKILG